MLSYRIGLYNVPPLDTLATFEQIPDGESFSIMSNRSTSIGGDGLKLFKLNDILYGLDKNNSFDYASIYNPLYSNYTATSSQRYAPFRTQSNNLQNIFQQMVGNSIPRILKTDSMTIVDYTGTISPVFVVYGVNTRGVGGYGTITVNKGIIQSFEIDLSYPHSVCVDDMSVNGDWDNCNFIVTLCQETIFS